MEGPDFSAATGDITSSFASFGTACLSIVGAIGAAAIVLFAAIYAWKYGKKLFNIISK